jgi:hypothetical protein
MRIILTGEWFWPCYKLAEAILRRRAIRYGPDIVIVLGDDTGVAASFALAAKGRRIKTEEPPADFGHLGEGGPKSVSLHVCSAQVLRDLLCQAK